MSTEGHGRCAEYCAELCDCDWSFVCDCGEAPYVAQEECSGPHAKYDGENPYFGMGVLDAVQV